MGTNDHLNPEFIAELAIQLPPAERAQLVTNLLESFGDPEQYWQLDQPTRQILLGLAIGLSFLVEDELTREPEVITPVSWLREDGPDPAPQRPPRRLTLVRDPFPDDDGPEAA